MVSSDYSFKHPSGISLQVLPWCHLTSDRHFFYLYILLILIFIYFCTNHDSSCLVLIIVCMHVVLLSWHLHSVYLMFIMFASTFKSTHWLVPGYLLGQTWRRTSFWRRTVLARPTLRRFPVSTPVSWSLPLVSSVKLPPHK
jgi:hypothetical protein